MANEKQIEEAYQKYLEEVKKKVAERMGWKYPKEEAGMNEHLTLDKLIEEQLIWECEDCHTKLIFDGKRRKIKWGDIDQDDLKYEGKTWYTMYHDWIVKVKNCPHKNKTWNPNYCRICGRKLTNRKSVDREIGPVCWYHSQQARADTMIAKEIREREVH